MHLQSTTFSKWIVTHCTHNWLFSSVSLSCVFKLPSLVNALSHFGQANGFSPAWVLSYLFNLPSVVNALSQFEQANGFSPIWVLSCSIVTSPLLVNDSHFEQTNGFSPCVFKVSLLVNALSHIEQANGFSLVWVYSCFFQITTLSKYLVTFWAGIWLLSSAGPFKLWNLVIHIKIKL